MAPPGINTSNDMTISSEYSSSLSTHKLSSLPSLPMSLPKSTISSQLLSIHADHDYLLKTQEEMRYNQATVTEPCDFVDTDISTCVNDAMLSSCSVISENVTREDGDTDFLMDLEDLDFGLGDLDPCCDVKMEDSFQEFIDSALEESSPDPLCMNFSDDRQHVQDPEIFHKEGFLARLDLRPRENVFSVDETWSSSSAPGFLFCNTWSSNTTSSDINFTVPSNDTTSCSFIPTKRCSCLGSDCIPKAVYSTAHVNHQDCVRICPSTLVTKSSNTGCTNCTQNFLAPDRVLSPLFIDTSLSECFESYQPLSEDHLHVSMDRSKLSEVEKDTADIMKWLKESQQHNNDDNNLSGRYRNRTFTETSSPRNLDDLESFVDLDDFLSETMDKGVLQYALTDDICQRMADHSEYESKDDYCASQLRFSFVEELSEHMLASDKFNRFGSHLDSSCESFSQCSPTPQTSSTSHCSSPTWSVADSNQSSPLGSMTFSLTSESKNTLDDFSLKSQLALLKLFSEENAESLLLTDSVVPNTRFV